MPPKRGKRQAPRKAGDSNDSENGTNKSEIADVSTSKYFKKDPASLGLPDTRVTGSDCNAPQKLPKSFFERSCEQLARALIGKVLVRKLITGEELRGKIVETEAYLGGDDKGSHSYQGKRTPRNEAMFMQPATAYVYSIHTYVCINISSQGDGAAVLLRSLEALQGHDTMRSLRGRRRKDLGRTLKDKELANGPSKLTEALAITKDEVNKLDLCNNDFLWLEEGVSVSEADIVSCPRINIDYADNWKDAKLRFYIKGNINVSVRNKVAESTEATQNNRLSAAFFDTPALQLAKMLLGKILCRRMSDGAVLRGRIIETEAYLGVADGSCHCYQGRLTAKTEAMFMVPGTAYVYNVYYKYCCFNISAKEEGAVVLIRSLEPLEGTEVMRTRRGEGRSDAGVSLKAHHLCNGPSKLCIALSIDKSLNKINLALSEDFFLLDDNMQIGTVVVSTRIGLEKVPTEWRCKPWRFYIRDNHSVSVRDKQAEQLLSQ